MSATTFIYGLVEPDTGKLRYIGKADNPELRVQQHLKSKARTHKKFWLDSLVRRGLLPKLEILLEVPKVDWQFWERDTIATFRWAGYDLVNGTDGGDGLTNPSAETRKKISDKSKLHRNSEDFKRTLSERMRGNRYRVGHSPTEEVLKQMSDQLAIYWTAERRAEFGKKMLGNTIMVGRKLSEEHKKNIGIKSLGNKNMLGKKASDETKARMSAASLGKPKSAAHIAALKAAWVIRKEKSKL